MLDASFPGKGDFIDERKKHIPSGCAITGFINRDRRRESGERIVTSIASLRQRSNGLGGGFSAYGIYPEFADYYALHLMYDTQSAKEAAERFIRQRFALYHEEPIPARQKRLTDRAPILWRYFVLPPAEEQDPDEWVARAVMELNGAIPGAYVFSSGKNMGTFKGVGYPEEMAELYRLEEYQGYMWLSHGRFPTNTPGWWGGAHPFSLLDWSVVHNGEISSYGTNRRYLETCGYHCSLFTDTEVIAYLLDLLHRRHGLSLDMTAAALASPFWSEIDAMPAEERELYTSLRQIYGGALLNGPFSIIVGTKYGLMGLTDRVKLRPLVVAEEGATLYMASEECAIRAISPKPGKVWRPGAGEPVLASFYDGKESREKGAA